MLIGFEPAQRLELAVALGLFHGFSKVLIVLGAEPAPGTMPITELATPRTDRPVVGLREGLAAVAAGVDRGVGPGHASVLAAARQRVGQLLGSSGGTRSGPESAGLAAVLDLTELFVVSVHDVTDELFAQATGLLGPGPMCALLVGLAVADADARLATSGAWAMAS